MALIIQGKELDLGHLAPFQRKVPIELRHGIKKTVTVEFHFSPHVYSRGPGDGETIPADLFVPDGSKHSPRNRIFDRARYELSRKLVAHLDAMITADDTVTRSRHNNFFHVSMAEVLDNGVAVQKDYYVFMSARKIAEVNQPKYIKVYVESAYPDTLNVPPPEARGSRSFGAMLGEYWELQKK